MTSETKKRNPVHHTVDITNSIKIQAFPKISSTEKLKELAEILGASWGILGRGDLVVNGRTI